MNTKPLYFMIILLFAFVIYLYMNYSKEVVIKEVPVVYYGVEPVYRGGWFGPSWDRDYPIRQRPYPRIPGPGLKPAPPGPGPQPAPRPSPPPSPPPPSR